MVFRFCPPVFPSKTADMGLVTWYYGISNHKAHTASKGKISVHQVAVIPEAHGKPDVVLQNATALKALVKGPYGESDVIGGMMSGGY